VPSFTNAATIETAAAVRLLSDACCENSELD